MVAGRFESDPGNAGTVRGVAVETAAWSDVAEGRHPALPVSRLKRDIRSRSIISKLFLVRRAAGQSGFLPAVLFLIVNILLFSGVNRTSSVHRGEQNEQRSPG